MKALSLAMLVLLVGCTSSEKEPELTRPEARRNLLPHAAAAPETHVLEVVPGKLDMTVEMGDCANNPGPVIRGSLAFGPIHAKVIFQNNLKGTHRHDEAVVLELVLVEPGVIEFDKQPSHGGVGGNPHIWVQLTREDGTPLTEEVYVGRCVQGSR